MMTWQRKPTKLKSAERFQKHILYLKKIVTELSAQMLDKNPEPKSHREQEFQLEEELCDLSEELEQSKA